MKISAIITCYNHEKWVNDAIDSILNQSHPVNQIIVVDDASTDKSFQKVYNRLYKPKQDSNGIVTGQFVNYKIPVKLAKLQKNSGPSVARNAGLHLGWEETDVFAFLDSDDIYHKTKIEKSIPFFENPLVGIVYSDYETWNEETGLRVKQYKQPFHAIDLMRECFINHDSLFAKKAYETCGFYEEDLRTVEDFSRYLAITSKFLAVHIPEPLITIRIGLHSSSSTVSAEDWKANYQKVMERTTKRMRGG